MKCPKQEQVWKIFMESATTPPTTVPTIKPFIKWVGGKTQILPILLSKFPPEMNNYHEPFLGGGSVLFAVLMNPEIQIRKNVYAYDINPALIAVYKNIQSPDTYPLLCEALTHLQREFRECPVGTKRVRGSPTPTKETAYLSKENYYYWVRNEYNAMSASVQQSPKGSAMFIFMNKTGFRGVFREGPNGINVPYGNPKNVTIFDPDHFNQIHTLIQPVIFQCMDFSRIQEQENIQKGDFIYFDPPYAPETITSFVHYTSVGFSYEKHQELFAWIHRLIESNEVSIVMSNSDVAMVRDAFIGCCIETIQCRRAIHSKNPGAKTNEIILKDVHNGLA